MILENNDMTKKSEQVANFLKSFANQSRLLILCELVEGEKSVSQIMEQTGIAQTSASQHLSKLKQEGIVSFRRDHRTLYYSISNNAALEIMQVLHKEFCADEN